MLFGDDEDEFLDEGTGDEGHEEGAEESSDQDDVEEGDAEGHERNAAKEDGDEEGQGRQVKAGRGADRFRTLRNENKDLAERLARYERELNEVKTQTQRPAEDPRLEADRLAMMTPEERMEYRFNQSQENHKRELARIQVQMWDTTDRQAFNSFAASHPVAAKYSDRVEQLHREQLQKGQPIDRQTILKYVVGEAALARGAKEAPKQRKAGQDRIDRQRVTPMNGRSNAQADRRGGKSLEDRLADVTI